MVLYPLNLALLYRSSSNTLTVPIASSTIFRPLDDTIQEPLSLGSDDSP